MRNLTILVVFLGILLSITSANAQSDMEQDEISQQIEMLKENFLDSNLDILSKQNEHFGEEQVNKMIMMIETKDFDYKFFSKYMDDLLSLKLNMIDSSLKTAEFEIDLLELSDDEKQKLIKEFRDISESAKHKITLQHEYYKSNISLVDNLIDISLVTVPIILERQDELVQEEKGGGCLIATAAFGSEMAPQVQFLREIRDNTVLQTQSGTSFMTAFNSFYYTFSPTIADYERENPVFKEAVKVGLTPLLTSLTILNYVDIDTEQEMLGYGIGIIMLNIGMYFVAPAVVIIALKKRVFTPNS